MIDITQKIDIVPNKNNTLVTREADTFLKNLTQ